MSSLIRTGSLQPLQHKEFRYFIIARFFLIMGLMMVGTVAGYKLFQLTHSSFSIGIAGLSEFVPVFCLALYAGHIIDKSDKRTLLIRGILLYAVCVVALIIITSSWFENTVHPKSPQLFFYMVIFFTGAIRAFTGPATNAILSQLVPRNILHFAANLSSSTWLAASIMGHASAGFFIYWFGVHNTYYIILAYILFAAAMISVIKKKPVVYNAKGVKTWESMKEGLRFVFSNKIMLGAISLDLFAVLFGGVKALIPEYNEFILKGGPQGFGLLNAAIDIGSVIIITLFTLRPMRKRQGYNLMYAVAGFGICIVVFGLSKLYWLSFFALVIAGMCDGISVMIRGTILQLTTPDEMRGRVSSVNSMFINSSNELGQFESGFMARALGTVPSVVFGGAMTLLVVIVTWIKAPSLRKFEY
ncbi:MAG TPA: MFS transporter [Chitinophagaceae bacterium]